MGTYTGTLPAAPVQPQSVLQTSTDAWYGILAAMSAAWTAYAPVWTSTGTAPAINNGTITGHYGRVGKLVWCTGVLTVGSTTTFGTGVWSLSLPVTAASANIGLYVGQAFLFDNSVTAGRQSGCASLNTTTTMTSYAGTGGQIAPAAPFTWAVSDKWSWTLWYEAA